MRLVADDQIHAKAFEETSGGANNTVLVSGYGQAIYDGSDLEIPEVPVVVHGSGEHYNPAVDFRMGAHDQTLEARVVAVITGAEDVAGSIREQGVSVTGATPQLVSPIAEVSD